MSVARPARTPRQFAETDPRTLGADLQRAGCPSPTARGSAPRAEQRPLAAQAEPSASAPVAARVLAQRGALHAQGIISARPIPWPNSCRCWRATPRPRFRGGWPAAPAPVIPSVASGPPPRWWMRTSRAVRAWRASRCTPVWRRLRTPGRAASISDATSCTRRWPWSVTLASAAASGSRPSKSTLIRPQAARSEDRSGEVVRLPPRRAHTTAATSRRAVFGGMA